MFQREYKCLSQPPGRLMDHWETRKRRLKSAAHAETAWGTLDRSSMGLGSARLREVLSGNIINGSNWTGREVESHCVDRWIKVGPHAW